MEVVSLPSVELVSKAVHSVSEKAECVAAIQTLTYGCEKNDDGGDKVHGGVKTAAMRYERQQETT